MVLGPFFQHFPSGLRRALTYEIRASAHTVDEANHEMLGFRMTGIGKVRANVFTQNPFLFFWPPTSLQTEDQFARILGSAEISNSQNR
jgi:hypothetical protein